MNKQYTDLIILRLDMSQHHEVELEQMRTLGIKALKNFQKQTSQMSLQTVNLIIEMAKEAVITDLKDDPRRPNGYDG